MGWDHIYSTQQNSDTFQIHFRYSYVFTFSSILIPYYHSVWFFYIFLIKKVIHKNVAIYTNIFLSLLSCFLSTVVLVRKCPSKKYARWWTPKYVSFMFNQYPFLLIQYIPSTSVGVYNSFIQEEIKLWFWWYWRK